MLYRRMAMNDILKDVSMAHRIVVKVGNVYAYI